MSDCSLIFSETTRMGGGTLRWMVRLLGDCVGFLPLTKRCLGAGARPRDTPSESKEQGN